MAGTIVADTLQNGAGTSTSMDNAINGSAKAWLRYNGSTSTINASYNVSSVTVNGTGDFTINFTNALTDANYSLVGCGSFADGTTGNSDIGVVGPYRGSTTPLTTTTARISVTYRTAPNTAFASLSIISVVINR